MKPTFHERLRYWRGIAVIKEAADALNVSVGTYQNWEAGRYLPRPALKEDIEGLMKLPTKWQPRNPNNK